MNRDSDNNSVFDEPGRESPDLYFGYPGAREERIRRILVEYSVTDESEGAEPDPDPSRWTCIQGEEHIKTHTSPADLMTDTLLIDADEGFIERNIRYDEGGGICRRYTHDELVGKLLDSLDPSLLFRGRHGCPSDAEYDRTRMQRYRITVEYDHAQPFVTEDYFNRPGLPPDYPKFAEAVERTVDLIEGTRCGYLFLKGYYNLVPSTGRKYIYLSVRFESRRKTYYYRTEDESIDVGDYVVVPVGECGKERIVLVVEKEVCPDTMLPLPLERTKSVIEKYDDSAPTVFCPLVNAEIPKNECKKHCLTEDEDDDDDDLEFTAPPKSDVPLTEQETEELRRKCAEAEAREAERLRLQTVCELCRHHYD